MRAGDRVEERFELLLPIRRGDDAELWQAQDVVEERPVTIGMLDAELLEDDGLRERFDAVATHPDTVARGSLSTASFADEAAYVVMPAEADAPLTELFTPGAGSSSPAGPDRQMKVVAGVLASVALLVAIGAAVLYLGSTGLLGGGPVAADSSGGPVAAGLSGTPLPVPPDLTLPELTQSLAAQGVPFQVQAVPAKGVPPGRVTGLKKVGNTVVISYAVPASSASSRTGHRSTGSSNNPVEVLAPLQPAGEPSLPPTTTGPPPPTTTGPPPPPTTTEPPPPPTTTEPPPPPTTTEPPPPPTTTEPPPPPTTTEPPPPPTTTEPPPPPTTTDPPPPTTTVPLTTTVPPTTTVLPSTP